MTRPRPPAILLAALLAPLSMALGYTGYRQAPALELSVTDALYGALQLFTVGGVIPEQTPWQLDVARFLAPLAVVYAAVLAAVALLRDRAESLFVRTFARQHVLVIGLGATGALVAQGLRKAGKRVVVLELDPANPRAASSRSDGVRVVTGDGTNPRHLRRARLDRADHVLVLVGDDSRNLEVAAVARDVLEQDGARRTTLHVAVNGAELWKELDRLRLADPRQGVTTEYLNLDDRTAQRILAAGLDVTRQTALTDVLVDGDTTVATRVVAHVVRRALLAGARPRILLTGAGGGEALYARLSLEEPWVAEHADLEALPHDGPHPEDAPGVALVCLVEADAAAITRGLLLARRTGVAPVVVAVYRPRSERTLEAAGKLGPRLHLVQAKLAALGVELLERSSIELMARVRHEDYLRKERAKGQTTETNPSLREWAELPDSLKESNRRFAEAVGASVGKLGGTLVPLTGPPVVEALPLPPGVLEELARGEHDRWVAEREDAGWKPTKGPKDVHAKLHPLLVPWEDLDEDEREKDRDAFRVLPVMLASVGYSIEMQATERSA